MSTAEKIAFHTLGCRSNFADSVDLQTALAEQGAVSCDFSGDSDVYVLNTCSVTDEADKEAFRILRKIRRRNPEARIVVTGCLAEVGAERLQALDAETKVIGPGRKEELLSAILNQSYQPSARKEIDLSEQYSNGTRAKRSAPEWRSISLDQPLSKALVGPGEFLGAMQMRSRYHLRVQEGCENSCTFCIIPTTRGRLSSRALKDILEDIQKLEQLGYQEIVLTGTHLGGYGVDLGTSLYQLLKVILAESPIRRIRLSSIDPNDLSTKITDLLADSNTFCNHLHICIQAFDSRTLKRMNRKYSLAEAEDLVKYIISTIPGICLGTDLIVGFPGETRAESDAAQDYFLASTFSYLHVFPYSERDGTAATRLADIVPIAERKRRAARMRALSRAKKNEYMRQLIGKTVEVLFEQEKDNLLVGTTREFMSAEAKTNAELGSTAKLKVVAFNEQAERLICV